MGNFKTQQILPSLVQPQKQVAKPKEKYECDCGRIECCYKAFLVNQILQKKVEKPVQPQQVQPIQLHQTITVNNGTDSWKKTMLKLACGATLGVLGVKYGKTLASKVLGVAAKSIGNSFLPTVAAPIVNVLGRLSTVNAVNNQRVEEAINPTFTPALKKVIPVSPEPAQMVEVDIPSAKGVGSNVTSSLKGLGRHVGVGRLYQPAVLSSRRSARR